MTKRWLSTFLLGASLATSALATPLSLSFSGTFDEDFSYAGYLNPHAAIGDTYSYQVSFDTDDFTYGSFSDSYHGRDVQDFWGQATWSGLIGSTPFAWTVATYARVQDGYIGTGGSSPDYLELSTNDWFPLGASGDIAHLYTWAEGSQATFSGTGLSNFGSMNALASTGQAGTHFQSHTSDWSSYQGYAVDNNPSVNSIQTSVPEPTLVSVLSSL